MRQMDFYFHDGCLSEQPILFLAREVRRECPSWTIVIHPLLEHEAKAMGFDALPIIVMNGETLATGIPKKDWLLEKMGEHEPAEP